MSTQKSEEFGVGLDFGYKEAIRGSAGFSWIETAQVQTQYTLGLAGGQSGQIMFMPAHKYVYGTLQWWNSGVKIHETKSWGASPKKLKTGELRALFTENFIIFTKWPRFFMMIPGAFF